MLTYTLFKTQSMLLSATSRKGQPDADLRAVQNPEHALVSNKQEEPARCWLTICSKPRACSCQWQEGRASQMLTYILFKTQSMLLSATRRKGHPDADLQAVQNPEHTLVSNKQEGPARCWLTYCSKPRACSCQKQAGRASQMLTYKLFKTQSMLLSATSRKGQPDADLQTVQNPEHALVSIKEEGPARCWLTDCSKPRACSCQHQGGRASQMLTYMLFKTQSMLLSETRRKGQPDADLQTVQNPEHALVSNGQEGPARCWLTSCSKPSVSNKQEGPARCWLTICSKPRACSCQKQAGRASQMLTYMLFKTQSMLLSATSRKGQPDADLHSVQNPEHALVRNKQEGPARCWLTFCSKPRACSCQQRAGRASQMLTYTLFKTQSMLLSASRRKGQPVADLHPVQNPEHALVSIKEEGPARCWLTSCSKPRACSCQQQGGRASQMLTYILFKTQSMLLSATRRKGQPDADLHPVQNPEHALVSNKEEGPARCWLTYCSKPRACSCQQQAGRASQMLTYILFKTQSMLLSASRRKGQPDADLHAVQNPEHALVSDKEEGPARCWLTDCSKPRACSCQQKAGRASQMLTYILFKTQSMLLSATSRKGQPDADLQTVQNPEHALVSNKQEGPDRCWLTCCSEPRACSCQQQAGRASQMLTYKLLKTQNMLLLTSEDEPKQNINLHSVYNQSTFLLASSWDQLDVGLHSV